MPHLHLSLQAGDDLILKRMKRRHCRGDAIAFCNNVRQLRPDVVFGADVIAGFPTESEEMFRRSMDLVAECGLTYLHVFPFSARKGTPAARMPQVSRTEVKDRASRLRSVGAEALASYLRSQQGLDAEVLVEQGAVGRTPQFAEVVMSGAALPVGSIARVSITGSDGDRLQGEVRA